MGNVRRPGKKYQKRPITKAQLLDLLNRSGACGPSMEFVQQSGSLAKSWREPYFNDGGFGGRIAYWSWQEWLIERLVNRGDLPESDLEAVRKIIEPSDKGSYTEKFAVSSAWTTAIAKAVPWSKVERALRRIA